MPLEPTGEPGCESARGHAFPVSLVDDLRNGERDAFVRFYELYRLAVYRFVLRLLPDHHDAQAATRATREVFVRAYRQVLLQGGAVDLTSLVYRAAVDTCREQTALETDPVAPPGADATAGHRREGERADDLAGRFDEALRSLDDRQRAALLLHDVHGLRADEIATVFGLSAEAAAALLFRAGEEFRRAFDEASTAGAEGECRLAEVTAASAVGRRELPDEEARRLRDHAAYCRQCRATVATWSGAAIGLALFADEAPLPDTLLAAPVFGTIGPVALESAVRRTGAGRAASASGSAAIVASLATIGRALTSKAAAYAVAAVCFAGFLGLVVYVSQHDWQPRVLIFPSGASAGGPTRHVGPAAGGRSATGGAAREGGAVDGQKGEGVTVPGESAGAVSDDRGVFLPALARLVVPVFGLAGHVVLPAAPVAAGSRSRWPTRQRSPCEQDVSRRRHCRHRQACRCGQRQARDEERRQRSGEEQKRGGRGRRHVPEDDRVAVSVVVAAEGQGARGQERPSREAEEVAEPRRDPCPLPSCPDTRPGMQE